MIPGQMTRTMCVFMWVTKEFMRQDAEGKPMSFREDLGQCGHPHKLNSIINGIAM